MSAFICSDKQFAVVAKALFAGGTSAQQFADALKRENITSYNHRYNEKVRVTRVKLDSATPDDMRLYSGHDILMLLRCIDYQSCEHPTYNRTLLDLAERFLEASGSTDDEAQPNLWSI